MSTRPSLLLVAPLALAAVFGASAAPGCYGATEISVAVTTTVPCSPNLVLTTQLFTGATGTTDFGTASAAETTACGPAEPRVGTLSIVPSGARDDQFDLEVVGAVGVPSTDCHDVASGKNAGMPGIAVPSTLTGCVVARRRVSFRPHKALTVPVLLSARCIGVQCGADQTCDLGICTSTADCTDQGCPRERGEVPAPDLDASVDSGTDAPIDAPADVDASTPSCGSTPQVVVSGQSIVGPLIKQGADFLFINAKTAGSVNEIRRISRAGGKTAKVAGSPAFLPAGTMLASLAATSTDLAWFEQATTATLTLAQDGGAPVRAPATGAARDKTSLAFSRGVLVGFWRISGGSTSAFTFLPASNTFVAGFAPASIAGDVLKVLVDDEGHFYGVAKSNALVHYTVDPLTRAPMESGRIDGIGTLVEDFALDAHTIYVGAVSAPGGAGPPPGIFRIAREAIMQSYTGTPWIQMSPPPQSIASDGVSLFYLVGTALWSVDLAAAMPVPKHLADVSGPATRLQVDDQCVYWVATDSMIMKRAKQ